MRVYIQRTLIRPWYHISNRSTYRRKIQNILCLVYCNLMQFKLMLISFLFVCFIVFRLSFFGFVFDKLLGVDIGVVVDVVVVDVLFFYRHFRKWNESHISTKWPVSVMCTWCLEPMNGYLILFSSLASNLHSLCLLFSLCCFCSLCPSLTLSPSLSSSFHL